MSIGEPSKERDKRAHVHASGCSNVMLVCPRVRHSCARGRSAPPSTSLTVTSSSSTAARQQARGELTLGMVASAQDADMSAKRRAEDVENSVDKRIKRIGKEMNEDA
eukprot:1468256-Pyramimonas_sp.AAC.1